MPEGYLERKETVNEKKKMIKDTEKDKRFGQIA